MGWHSFASSPPWSVRCFWIFPIPQRPEHGWRRRRRPIDVPSALRFEAILEGRQSVELTEGRGTDGSIHSLHRRVREPSIPSEPSASAVECRGHRDTAPYFRKKCPREKAVPSRTGGFNS